ncbi:MAG: ABC transporter ATP-binding protein [Candidatus Brocadiia bacterium]
MLQVRGLRTTFYLHDAVVQAVDGVDLEVRRGECVGLVGESGCGKSVTALSVLRLVPSPPGRIEGGQVLLGGRDLLSLPRRRMRQVRGGEVAMVFQEPMSSLNPALTVGFQIAEAIMAHRQVGRAAARAEAVDLLRRVQIPEPEQRASDYPHQLSGGMRQRAMVAMAVACRPRLLIADEPTTALDVTIQAQIMELFASIRAESDLALLLVTHDLGLVAQMADRVAVMYAGRIVETAPVDAIFGQARHPYTHGLLRSIPRVEARSGDLAVIPGTVPDLARRPPGCAFQPRCERAAGPCAAEEPPTEQARPGHTFACWNPCGSGPA